MALDLSLISAQDIIRQRHSKQSNIVNLFTAPLSQLNVSQLEEAKLFLLDSLYEDEAELHGSGISYQHYHLPILMTATDPTTARPLVEAWLRSALYMSYNLVLLVPDKADPAPIESLLDAYPEAQSHLCLRSLDRAEAQLLMAGISEFLPVQEPHLYVSLEVGDPQLLEAMSNTFLGLSLYPRLGFHDGSNGFQLESIHPRTLAYQLVDILEDSRMDWEILQEIAQRGRIYAQRENYV